LGTHRDNVDDKMAKGRQARGSRGGHAKLKEGDIPTIRDRIAAGECKDDIARDFKVSQAAITLIARGKNWAHVR